MISGPETGWLPIAYDLPPDLTGRSSSMSTSRCLVLGAAIVAALVASTSATATRPEITRFSFEDAYLDTQTCPGIPMDTELEGHVTIREFSSTRVQVHQRLIYTVTGNGKTFTDNESFTEFANPESGITRFAGTTVNIQIPGHGNVLADRGTLTIDFTTEPWTVLHEGGPHPLFHNGYEALCAYLAS
jgi:hypothetical protein